MFLLSTNKNCFSAICGTGSNNNSEMKSHCFQTLIEGEKLVYLLSFLELVFYTPAL